MGLRWTFQVILLIISNLKNQMRQWLMHLESIWVHGWATSSQELKRVEKEFLIIYVIASTTSTSTLQNWELQKCGSPNFCQVMIIKPSRPHNFFKWVSKFNNLKVYLISNLRKFFQCHIKAFQWELDLTLELTISIVVKHFQRRDLNVNASSTFKLGNKMYFQWWKITLSWTMNQNMEWMQKCSNTLT